jgi:hypothetical protein
MEILTVSELWHLTRDELCDLWDRMIGMLPDLEAGSVARWNALQSLANITRVLNSRRLTR